MLGGWATAQPGGSSWGQVSDDQLPGGHPCLAAGSVSQAERAGQVEKQIPLPRGSHQPGSEKGPACRCGGQPSTPAPQPVLRSREPGTSGAGCSLDHLFIPAHPPYLRLALAKHTGDHALWLWVGICPRLLAFLVRAPWLWVGDPSVCSLRGQTDA